MRTDIRGQKPFWPMYEFDRAKQQTKEAVREKHSLRMKAKNAFVDGTPLIVTHAMKIFGCAQEHVIGWEKDDFFAVVVAKTGKEEGSKINPSGSSFWNPS